MTCEWFRERMAEAWRAYFPMRRPASGKRIGGLAMHAGPSGR